MDKISTCQLIWLRFIWLIIWVPHLSKLFLWPLIKKKLMLEITMLKVVAEYSLFKAWKDLEMCLFILFINAFIYLTNINVFKIVLINIYNIYYIINNYCKCYFYCFNFIFIWLRFIWLISQYSSSLQTISTEVRIKCI